MTLWDARERGVASVCIEPLQHAERRTQLPVPLPKLGDDHFPINILFVLTIPFALRQLQVDHTNHPIFLPYQEPSFGGALHAIGRNTYPVIRIFALTGMKGKKGHGFVAAPRLNKTRTLSRCCTRKNLQQKLTSQCCR